MSAQFHTNTLWLDVRSPSEFAKGHIPGAINLPLFSDKEREIVGTIYARQGKDRAVRRGLTFVGPRMAQMVEQVDALQEENNGVPSTIQVYCARGGMRSSSVAWLLRTAGMEVSVLPGGFRAYKHSLVTLTASVERLIVLRGETGSGKTDLLHQLKEMGEQVVDLEELAEHKGSAFGKVNAVPQPTNEMLYCLLIETLAGMDPTRPIYVEGESKRIGRCEIPDVFFAKMRSAEIVTVHSTLNDRTRRIHQDYGSTPPEHLLSAFEHIADSMGLETALHAERAVREGDLESAILLALRYYDKLYAKSGNRLFLGDEIGEVEHPLGRTQDTAATIIRLTSGL